MDTLPDPQNQLGLVAYYRFNSLTNKASPGFYDGSLVGLATIANQDTFCGVLGAACSVLEWEDGEFLDDSFAPPSKRQEVQIRESDGKITIEILPLESSVLKVRIFSLGGQQVFEKTKFLPADQVAFSQWTPPSSGLYFVEVWINGWPYRKKVIL